MSKLAVVTGAGSGVGRAVALRFGRAGWDVALIGRTKKTLEETVALGKSTGVIMVAFPCDVGDELQVERLPTEISRRLGEPEALINCAGINVKRRSMAEISLADFDATLRINLRGAYLCARAFLPAMRKRKRGTIVNVGSDAGLLANPMSGAAYVASKFGLTGLTDVINAEERKGGIRACGIYPGEIDTPLLDQRPTIPTSEQRSKMLKPEDVAECVMLAVQLPDRAVVETLVIRPR